MSKSEEFVKSILPSVRELMDLCLNMTEEEYQEYLKEERKYFKDLNRPEASNFFEELYKLAGEYRECNEVEKQIRLYDLMDEHNCDMDTAELLLLLDEEEEAAK